jgi:putative nucleotidyltransferase with HDIG domain
MSLPELLRRARGVVTLPEVYYRAQDVIDDPNCDLGTLARIIQSDGGLTARLLKTVNSPLYGLPRRVDRVSYALTLMGKQALRDLVLATGVLRSFTGISPRLVDMATFWHHGIYCALIARRLAKRCRILHEERLLVAGMLHDIGQLVLYQMQPALAAEALELADNTDDGLYRAEREVFGYTHADVGGQLLEAWRLPDSLKAAARYHHEPLEAGEHVLETCIVHLANSIANRLEPGRNILECRPVIEPRAWAITGLPEEAGDQALSEANEEFLDVLDLLLPGKPFL